MAAKDQYSGFLPRDAKESERLNYQHTFLVKNVGYLVHPTIKDHLPSQNAQIADLATGTGIWMTDVAKEQPPSTTFIGLDNSSEQFPPPSALPANVSFAVLDATSPSIPSSRYASTFDLLHIRFLTAGLTSSADWTSVARNAFHMLKPGGWLQWHECDFEQGFTPLRERPEQRTPALQELLNTLKPNVGFLFWSTGRLAGALEEVGFEEVLDEATSTDRVAETRRAYTRMTVGALAGAYGNVMKAGGMSGEEVERRIEKVEEEIAGGGYIRGDFHVYLGRRPLGS